VTDFDATLRQLHIPLIFRSILADYLLVKAENDLFLTEVSALLAVSDEMTRPHFFCVCIIMR